MKLWSKLLQHLTLLNSIAENVRSIFYSQIVDAYNLLSEVANIDFPRMQTMEILLYIVRQQPKLTKEASSALIDLGEAIHATAAHEEIDVLIQGTLLQEAYARNSCLQAIQVFIDVQH